MHRSFLFYFRTFINQSTYRFIMKEAFHSPIKKKSQWMKVNGVTLFFVDLYKWMDETIIFRGIEKNIEDCEIANIGRFKCGRSLKIDDKSRKDQWWHEKMYLIFLLDKSETIPDFKEIQCHCFLNFSVILFLMFNLFFSAFVAWICYLSKPSYIAYFSQKRFN